MGKNDSQVRNYILVGISAGVIAGCYFVTNLYGRDIRVIILLAIALLTFGLSTNNILKLFVIKESIETKKQ